MPMTSQILQQWLVNKPDDGEKSQFFFQLVRVKVNVSYPERNVQNFLTKSLSKSQKNQSAPEYTGKDSHTYSELHGQPTLPQSKRPQSNPCGYLSGLLHLSQGGTKAYSPRQLPPCSELSAPGLGQSSLPTVGDRILKIKHINFKF